MRRALGWTRIQVMVGLLGFAGSVCAEEILFESGFEAPITTDPQPRYSWETSDRMPHGAGDFFERTGLRRHTGRFALRLNYEGRNGVGDLCLPVRQSRPWIIVEQGDDADSNLVIKDSEGRDLGALLEERNIEPVWAFNESCGFERWKVRSVVGSNVFLDGEQPELAAVGGRASCAGFSPGDRIRVTRACGEGERRIDINVLENELQGYRKRDLRPGESIFARMYFMVPSAPLGPDRQPTQKLIRMYFENNIAIICEMQAEAGPMNPRSLEMVCEYPGGRNIHLRGRIERDIWNYLELEVRRSSTAGAADGYMRMWVAKDGEPVTEAVPSGEVSEIVVPAPGRNRRQFVVMIGNSPSGYVRSGSLFFDDFVVSKAFNGQNVGTRPMAPSNLEVR